MAIRRLLAASLAGVLGLAILPARAGWREDLGTFRIGMVATPGSGAVIEGAATVRNAYSTALAMPVEIFVARDYGALIDAQVSSRIEYAIHSSSSYAAAFRMCGCVEPLVAPVSEDGSLGIRSVLIARAGGPGSTADLSTARIAFGPRDSTSGFRLPLAELAPRGSPLTGAEPFLVSVASESEAERAFLDGTVDAMFGYVPSSKVSTRPTGGTLARLAAAGVADLNVLWSSGLLMNGPHAVRINLDPEAKAALRAFLVGLRDAEPDVYDIIEKRAAGGFVEVVPADYETALKLVDKIAARDAAGASGSTIGAGDR